MLLPPEEGGIDRTKKLKAFQLRLFPGAAVLQGYADLGLSHSDLNSAEAQQQLGRMAEVLWRNYVRQPGEQLLRGRLEDGTRRIVRIQRVQDEAARPKPAVVAKWRKQTLTAYNANPRDPAMIAAIWDEDYWLGHLLTAPDDDPSSPKQVPKGLLSEMVLAATAEPLRQQCAFLLALRWHEKAERLRAQAAQMVAAKATAAEIDSAKVAALDAWASAAQCWGAYSHENPLTAEHLRTRMDGLAQRAKQGEAPWATSLRQHLGWLVRQGAAGRLLQAQALEQSGKKPAAAATLNRLISDLNALESEPNLDIGPDLYWMRYGATLRAGK